MMLKITKLGLVGGAVVILMTATLPAMAYKKAKDGPAMPR